MVRKVSSAQSQKTLACLSCAKRGMSRPVLRSPALKNKKEKHFQLESIRPLSNAYYSLIQPLLDNDAIIWFHFGSASMEEQTRL